MLVESLARLAREAKVTETALGYGRSSRFVDVPQQPGGITGPLSGPASAP